MTCDRSHGRSSVLQYAAACCSVLQCGAVWCSVLQCSCRKLQCSFYRKTSISEGSRTAATYCNTPQHNATHCNTLQHSGAHWVLLNLVLLQLPHATHTATHCNTLQYTATHCNTLQYTGFCWTSYCCSCLM